MLNIASNGTFSDENCVICWLSILKCWEPRFLFSTRQLKDLHIYTNLHCNNRKYSADLYICVTQPTKGQYYETTVNACVHYNLCGYYVPLYFFHKLLNWKEKFFLISFSRCHQFSFIRVWKHSFLESLPM